MKPSSRNVGIALLALTILLFSTFEVTSKFLSPRLAPTQITFLRFLIGGLSLLPFALLRIRRNRVRLRPVDFLNFSVLGVVNIVVSMGLIQWGLAYANASVAAALFSINPLFVMVFARAMLKERITPRKAIGLAFGIAGIALLFADGISRKTSTLPGLLLILASAVCFAFYTVLGKKLITKEVDSLIVTAFSFLIGSVFLVPLQIGMQVALFPDVSSIVVPLLYMSIAVTGIAYVSYFEGLSRLEVGAGSMLYFAKPALASVFAVLLLHESVGIELAAGIAVIAIGIFIAQTGRGEAA